MQITIYRNEIAHQTLEKTRKKSLRYFFLTVFILLPDPLNYYSSVLAFCAQF